jgi:DNA invertase Pin-like site-specific DNA recombinase
MTGKNWNSKTQEWTSIKGPEAQEKAQKAFDLRSQGLSVKEIAKALNLSKSRVYEYLRQ